MNDRRSEYQWRPLLVGAVILILSHYAALLFRVQPAVSLWFPPAGVSVTLAIWFGAPAAIVTGIVSTILAPLWGTSGWAQFAGLIDGLEPLVAWWLYRCIWQRSMTLNRLKDVSAFLLSAPVFASAALAIAGTVTLAFTGKIPWNNTLTAIPHWWLGNAMGILTLTPVSLLTLTPILHRHGWIHSSTPSVTSVQNLPEENSRLRTEKITILVMSLAIALLSVSHTQQTGFTFQQFSFLNFIPILWAAVRFGAVGGACTASFCVIATLLSYILKYPDALVLQNFPIDPTVLTVHKLSLVVQCAVGLLMGTAITQQTQAQVKLAIAQIQLAEYEARSQLNQQLERINQELEQTNQEKDILLLREQTARSQAEAANRVKDEFLAIVSHELRTPLNPILGWSKLLQSGKLDATATQKALETIDRNAKLQANLIEDLLDISRILRGKLVLNKIELDLGLIVRSVIETVRLSAEAKAITLSFTPPESPVFVYGDPNRLQQVIVNLLTNAIKFTPEQGTVAITLETETTETKVRVKDTGKGIHPDFLPYVFERFRQEDSGTTRNFGGLGLGLAIVRHLVELHHGKVEAQSEGINQGATFIVKLPTIDANETTLPEIISSFPRSLRFLEGKRLLVVEDDADARELLRYILESEGATVLLASSAQSAIKALSSSENTAHLPDLIISDISMPDMDGYSFIRQVRTMQRHRVPAIAVTANVREQDRLNAIAAGFDAHLAKPITPEVLLSEIERLLRVIYSQQDQFFM